MSNCVSAWRRVLELLVSLPRHPSLQPRSPTHVYLGSSTKRDEVVVADGHEASISDLISASSRSNK
jgi:hypothetical protein